jgi:anti-sigma regulatory factor (Ser/Thr protein kinase)
MTTKAGVDVRNDFAELERLYEFLTAFWVANRLEQDAVLDLNLALEEAFTNVLMHGFRDPGEHEIHVELAFENNVVCLTVEDGGIPFNPLEAPDVDVTAPLGERRIGGLGIYLVRKLMDRVEYAREGNRNRLRMEKRVTCANEGND